MKYCPSATCAYAVKYRRPLEYRNEIVTCAECGAGLSDQAPVFDVVPEGKPAPIASEQDVLGRLAVTVIAAVLIWIGTRTTLFGFSTDAAAADLDVLTDFSLLGFGLAPFQLGFVIVEVVAFGIPALQRRRVGSAEERAPLDRAALFVGAVLLLPQIATFARYLDAESSVFVESPSQPWIWAQYLIAHLCLLALAIAVTRRGLLNGFALVVLVQVASWVFTLFESLWESFSLGALAPGTMLLTALLPIALATVVLRLSRASRPSGQPGPTVVPFPVSGEMPVIAAGALISLPITLAAFFPPLGAAGDFLQGSPAISTAVTAFLIVDCTLLFGFFFFRPRVVGTLWVRWVKDADGLDVVMRARALLPRALLLAGGLLLVGPLSAAVLNVPGVASADGLALETMVVSLVLADLAAEWRARRTLGRDLVSVRPLHRMAEVEPVCFLLRRAGIPFFARSVAFRAALQFFGSYVPVEILVPRDRADEARRLLDAA